MRIVRCVCRVWRSWCELWRIDWDELTGIDSHKWESKIEFHCRLRNRGFFDDDGNAMPVISVLDRFPRH